jgi:two-component system, NarL family, sensor kinase
MYTAEPLSRSEIDIAQTHIAVLDQAGTIISVNQAWIDFARANGSTVADTGVGINYLDVCRRTQGDDILSAQTALNGIQDVLDRKQVDFVLEYPCHSHDTERWFLMQVLPLDTTVGGGVIFHHNITEHHRVESEKVRLHAEVVQQREQLRALSRRLAEIQEMERKSIVRELHDRVGQNLTALGLTLKLIQIQLPTESTAGQQINEQLQNALALVTQTSSSIRNLMTELRPVVLDDYGLLAALRWYSTQIAANQGLKIHVYGESPEPRLPEAVENALFRIAQEAIMNIVKHAQTTQARVQLTTTEDRVILEIIDNGRGFDAEALMATTAQPHWGLLNMRERAEAIGGHWQIVSHPNQGVSIVVEVKR